MASILRCSRTYQRLILRVVLAVALVTAILCFSSTWPPAVNAEDPQLPRRELQESQDVLAAGELTKQPVIAQEPTPPQRKDEVKSSDQVISKGKVSAISGQDWDAAADRIETLLGDEYRLKALLAPITETGEPLLRDLTHRVRAYGSILKTWEELHLSASDGKWTDGGTLLSMPILTFSRWPPRTPSHPAPPSHDQIIAVDSRRCS
jgi:hypothetical protein